MTGENAETTSRPLGDASVLFERDETSRQSSLPQTLGRLGDDGWHDLNNFLAIILGNAEQIAEEAGASDIGEMACAIIEAADACAVLNRRLLTVARLLNPRPEIVELDEFVASLFPAINEGMRNQAVTTDFRAGTGRCSIDKVVLEGTIANLLADFAEGGTLGVATGRTRIVGARFLTMTLGKGGIQAAQWRQMDESETGSQAGGPDASALALALNFARRSGGDVRIGEVRGDRICVEILLPELDPQA